MNRQFARTYQLTTTPTYLPGTDSRTNVVLDRIIVCALGGTDDVITFTDGEGTTLLELTATTGQATPFALEIHISSGSGIKVSAGSPSTSALVTYFNSSRRHELPSGI